MASPDITQDLTQIFGPGEFTTQPGRGNSSVGVWNGQHRYFVKVYPQDDSWNRRASEKQAIDYYRRHGITNVPEIHHSHVALNYSVFSYIDGTPYYDVTADAFEQIQLFLSKIMNLSAIDDFVSEAKEAFFTTTTLKSHIDKRLVFLRTIDDPMLQEYLKDGIDDCLTAINYNDFPDRDFGKKAIISPSDFGTHNSLLTGDKRLYFIDFEYAGRDSFFKLMSDIYWHPGSNLTLNQRSELIAPYLTDAEDRSIYRLVRLLMGIKWSLLLLNEFIPFNLQRRMKASGDAMADAQKIKTQQLVKSKNVLRQVIDDWRCGI